MRLILGYAACLSALDIGQTILLGTLMSFVKTFAITYEFLIYMINF